MENEPLIYTRANGEVEIAANADIARAQCPFLGQLSLEDANVFLSLIATGQEALAAAPSANPDVPLKMLDGEARQSTTKLETPNLVDTSDFAVQIADLYNRVEAAAVTELATTTPVAETTVVSAASAAVVSPVGVAEIITVQPPVITIESSVAATVEQTQPLLNIQPLETAPIVTEITSVRNTIISTVAGLPKQTKIQTTETVFDNQLETMTDEPEYLLPTVSPELLNALSISQPEVAIELESAAMTPVLPETAQQIYEQTLDQADPELTDQLQTIVAEISETIKQLQVLQVLEQFADPQTEQLMNELEQQYAAVYKLLGLEVTAVERQQFQQFIAVQVLQNPKSTSLTEIIDTGMRETIGFTDLMRKTSQLAVNDHFYTLYVDRWQRAASQILHSVYAGGSLSPIQT